MTSTDSHHASSRDPFGVIAGTKNHQLWNGCSLAPLLIPPHHSPYTMGGGGGKKSRRRLQKGSSKRGSSLSQDEGSDVGTSAAEEVSRRASTDLDGAAELSSPDVSPPTSPSPDDEESDDAKASSIHASIEPIDSIDDGAAALEAELERSRLEVERLLEHEQHLDDASWARRGSLADPPPGAAYQSYKAHQRTASNATDTTVTSATDTDEDETEVAVSSTVPTKVVEEALDEQEGEEEGRVHAAGSRRASTDMVGGVEEAKADNAPLIAVSEEEVVLEGEKRG